jgi:hypothetical protein
VRAELLPPPSTRRAHAEPIHTSRSYLGFRCVVRNSGGMTPQTPFLSRRRDVTTDPVEIAMILAGILAVVAIAFVL